MLGAIGMMVPYRTHMDCWSHLARLIWIIVCAEETGATVLQTTVEDVPTERAFFEKKIEGPDADDATFAAALFLSEAEAEEESANE